MLFCELQRLADLLFQLRLSAELWIDGSFVTNKEDPDDIDLSIIAWADEWERLDTAQYSRLVSDLEGKVFSPVLHTFLMFTFPSDDPRYTRTGIDYWSEKWGVGWDNKLTGFAVLKLDRVDA